MALVERRRRACGDVARVQTGVNRQRLAARCSCGVLGKALAAATALHALNVRVFRHILGGVS